MKEEEEQDDPIYIDMEYEQSDSRFEVVSICNQALNAVEGINVMSKEDDFRVNEIKRKALRLIEHQINMMYDEHFED
jgi:hypothetical protein